MYFAFVDRMTGVVKYDGLLILRMMIEISKPDTVIINELRRDRKSVAVR